MITSSRRSFLLGFSALIAAPAIVRADNLMPVRSIAQLLLPEATFDSFDKLIPGAMQYQWFTDSVMDDRSFSMIDKALERGWKTVPVDRHNNIYAIKGDRIQVGGMVLMEKPVDASRTVPQVDAWRNVTLSKTGFLGGVTMILETPSGREYIVKDDDHG